ncbi:hypothetical protein [Desulfuromonas sp. AOP6]|uniref:hypothetical protein n=1 Tax=Desulfuromonas sp. AOP6 TaxID=1566351 RepID=UPI0012737519|nr:hypothetical protein [Desulfuromonas sp. AOP6]BCA80268.1 hypothetical protein AOP6_2055 [Desulfuromonas sp. AOP6]
MAERNTPVENEKKEPGLDKNLERLDAELEIMERHSPELDSMEEEEREALKKRDREYKDEHLHSVPRPRKHVR